MNQRCYRENILPLLPQKELYYRSQPTFRIIVRIQGHRRKMTRYMNRSTIHRTDPCLSRQNIHRSCLALRSRYGVSVWEDGEYSRSLERYPPSNPSPASPIPSPTLQPIARLSNPGVAPGGDTPWRVASLALPAAPRFPSTRPSPAS